MDAALILELEAEDDAWRVSLRRPAGAAVIARLPSDRVRGILATIAATRAPGGLVPTEADHCEAEERAGSALFEVLRSTPELLALWSETLGAASPAPLLVAVSAADPAISALPWELLGDQAPLEAQGRGTILRLLPGPSPRPEAPWSIQLWPPPAHHPELAPLAASMASSQALLPTSPGSLLLAATHGELDDHGRFVALEAGGAKGAAGLVQALEPQSLRLAVFLCCHAEGPQAGTTLTARLLAAGAGAVVAPAARLGLEAADTFQRALVQGLSGGEGIALAVMGARRAVAALGLPHGDGRSHRLRLSVSHLAGLMDPAWTGVFGSWPAPSAAARLVLQAAEDLARRQGLGFVGVEHLLEVYRDGLPDEARALEPALSTRQARVRTGGARWREDPWGLWPGNPRVPLTLTPRLHHLATVLPPGFLACELFECLALHAATTALRWLGLPMPPQPDSHDPTMPSVAAHPRASLPAGPVAGLECIGGPDDGLRLQPAPGDTIGRFHPSGPPDHCLQRGTAQDRRTSRHHLRWEGPARLKVLKARTWLLPDHQPLEAGTILDLHPGTTLHLGGGTWLQAFAADAPDPGQ